MLPTSTSSAWLEFPSGESFPLKEGTTSIGRAPGNRLIIGTERISRHHAAIRQESDGTFMLVDLGSSNGTFLNGQRLTRPVILRNGWIIEIGLQKMTFRTPPVPGAGPEAAEGTSAPCWLLAVSATQLGCRTPGEEMVEKTFESWSERAGRVVAKYRGRTIRARDEGLIAYWPVQSADSRASTVAAVLRSLSIARRQTEEFRLSLHHGLVNLRVSPTGEEAPSGPEVMLAVQLDRLASTLKTPVLLTEAAREALGETLPTRRLTVEEIRDYSGEQRFYTLVE
jgi:hypothetical protein